jgi:hypothetical protein
VDAHWATPGQLWPGQAQGPRPASRSAPAVTFADSRCRPASKAASTDAAMQPSSSCGSCSRRPQAASAASSTPISPCRAQPGEGRARPGRKREGEQARRQAPNCANRRPTTVNLHPARLHNGTWVGLPRRRHSHSACLPTAPHPLPTPTSPAQAHLHDARVCHQGVVVTQHAAHRLADAAHHLGRELSVVLLCTESAKGMGCG